jgi:hypothetical protein
MKSHRKRKAAAQGDPNPHLEFCVLCGSHCEPAECRHVDAAVAQRAIRVRCAPTAFHYGAVMAMSQGDRRAMCLSCVNWRRQPRGAAGIRREKLRAYTPLDRSAATFFPHRLPYASLVTR